ncbi:MAG TPA: hypothetical protein VK501_19860 [Baekduia sp.]|uniref:hypothetical protein n=1 Tax=Baekduia sp. TaxID=2600305 RepID=UPI002C03F750|nr:hypothetical protein [Baekduia sp.]HMJ36168.1 hypothetical protein [Baekduia sp.]
MSGRDPDQILHELGGALQDAWAADARRRHAWPRPRVLGLRLRVGRRGLVAAAAAALALVPTAIATRDAVWAPDPPPLPAQLRPHDAVVPGAGGTPVYVGEGTQRDVAWRLSATTCRYGPVQAVGLFLTVPGGGAGARCDVATRQSGASPQALAARRVQTYYDPVSGKTWAFGALPAEARMVSVTSRPYGGGAARTEHVAATPVDARAIEQGHLPAGLRVFVVALDGGRDVAHVAVTDTNNNSILTCDGGRCDR